MHKICHILKKYDLPVTERDYILLQDIADYIQKNDYNILNSTMDTSLNSNSLNDIEPLNINDGDVFISNENDEKSEKIKAKNNQNQHLYLELNKILSDQTNINNGHKIQQNQTQNFQQIQSQENKNDVLPYKQFKNELKKNQDYQNQAQSQTFRQSTQIKSNYKLQYSQPEGQKLLQIKDEQKKLENQLQQIEENRKILLSKKQQEEQINKYVTQKLNLNNNSFEKIIGKASDSQTNNIYKFNYDYHSRFQSLVQERNQKHLHDKNIEKKSFQNNIENSDINKNGNINDKSYDSKYLNLINKYKPCKTIHQ
ncbi:hypothetical protein PPERSA_00394 [Pseudocohnilembus persalinus]|uniref:Uncharacterized protein n=1 Tax=Pseudocohnilembus persalinus TaxID=266149 RepID=A0A0V0QZC8_PSEPJ|nr:hypothetical protein PPERSA_00394 [Pseudocohnilembus persalinus]|eukprot:KRX07237.1 hypothetical protein PPERSA_00394 [Pseudocohnilembus persalinus]